MMASFDHKQLVTGLKRRGCVEQMNGRDRAILIRATNRASSKGPAICWQGQAIDFLHDTASNQHQCEDQHDPTDPVKCHGRAVDMLVMRWRRSWQRTHFHNLSQTGFDAEAGQAAASVPRIGYMVARRETSSRQWRNIILCSVHTFSTACMRFDAGLRLLDKRCRAEELKHYVDWRIPASQRRRHLWRSHAVGVERIGSRMSNATH